MKNFMDENFLLYNSTGEKLYHSYAAKMPIIDYHCHISPKEIAINKSYSSISEAWLYEDHYKWRLMRAGGIEEEKITGAINKKPDDLFKAYASVLPKAIGNPLYHWTHLELQRFFDIYEPLNESNADKIYKACNKKLIEDKSMSVKGLIKKSNVEIICTTDDPADNLEWHRKIKEDKAFETKVLPTFRPDNYLNIEKPNYSTYIKKLEQACGLEIKSFSALCNSLNNRALYFEKHGCRVSDHGLEYICHAPSHPDELENIFNKALNSENITIPEANKFRTALLIYLAEFYSKHGWAMQIHFGCMRNNNKKMYSKIGADTGFDAMNGNGQPQNLAGLLNAMDENGCLPKTVLYSLNPYENETIASIAGCFNANAGCKGKIQLGAAWWFNDSKTGIEKQFSDYGNIFPLGYFIGMLTDSRSFLSYTRHEYFRRILCNYLGALAENGEYPLDYNSLGQIVENICYNNAKSFFNFQ